MLITQKQNKYIAYMPNDLYTVYFLPQKFLFTKEKR